MKNSLIVNQKSQKPPFRFSSFAFIALCGYLGLLALSYIEFIPMALSSLALYGYILLGAVTLVIYKEPRFSAVSMWLFTFVLICLFSCIYSVSRSVSLSTTIEMAKVFLFSFILYNIVDTKDRVERILMVTSLSTTLLIVYLIYTGDLFVEDERLGQELTGNANILAGLLMLGAFSSVYFISFSKTRFKKGAFLISLLLQLFALSLTGSRKFFVLPVVLFCVMLALNTNRKGKRHVLIKSIFAIAIFLGVFWLLFNVDFFYNAIGYRMEGLLNLFSDSGKVDASTMVRSELLNQSIEFWKRSPIVGNGIDCFKVLSGYGVYAHNNYGELLCDTGVLGAIAYSFVYIFLLKHLLKVKTDSPIKWYWVCLIICLAIYDIGAVTYTSYRNHMLFVLAYLVTEKRNAGMLEFEY